MINVRFYYCILYAVVAFYENFGIQIEFIFQASFLHGQFFAPGRSHFAQ
jgi:hypothetical protein